VRAHNYDPETNLRQGKEIGSTFGIGFSINLSGGAHRRIDGHLSQSLAWRGMKQPVYKRLLMLLALTDLLFFGSVLDTISNSIMLITPAMTLVGTTFDSDRLDLGESLAKRNGYRWYVGQD
jgi:hypothetical protein